MESNNTILFMFSIIFLLIGFLTPYIQNDFNQKSYNNDLSMIEDVGQNDITSVNAIEILSSIFFWVFDAPIVINILLTVMR